MMLLAILALVFRIPSSSEEVALFASILLAAYMLVVALVKSIECFFLFAKAITSGNGNWTVDMYLPEPFNGISSAIKRAKEFFYATTFWQNNDSHNTTMDPVFPASSQQDVRKAKKALKRRQYKLKLKHRSSIVGGRKVQGVEHLDCKSNLVGGSKSSALAIIEHRCIVQHHTNGTVDAQPSSLEVAIPGPVEATSSRSSTRSSGIQRPSSAESTSRSSEDPKQRRQRLKNKRRNDRRREEKLNAWKTKQEVLKGSTSERIKTSIDYKPSAMNNAGSQKKDSPYGCSSSLRSVKKACPFQGGDSHRATRHSSVTIKQQTTEAVPVRNLEAPEEGISVRGISTDTKVGQETHGTYIKTGIMLGSSQKVEARVGSLTISELNTKFYDHLDIVQTLRSTGLAQSSGCRHTTQTGSLGSTDVQLASCVSLEESQVISAETALMDTATRAPSLEEVCNMNTTAASVISEDSTVQVVDSNLMVANEETSSSTGIKNSVAGLMDVPFNSSVGDKLAQVNSRDLERQRSKTLDSVVLPTLGTTIRKSKTLSALDTLLGAPDLREFIESKSSLVFANGFAAEEPNEQDTAVPPDSPSEADPSSATVEKPTSAIVVSSLEETNVLDLKGEIRCGLLTNESSLKIEPKDVVTEDLQVTPLRKFPSKLPLAKKIHNKGTVIRDQQDAVKTKILAAIKARKETERLAMEKSAAEKEAKRKTKNRLKKEMYASRKLKRVNAEFVDTEMNPDVACTNDALHVKGPESKVEADVPLATDTICSLEIRDRNGGTDTNAVDQRENVESSVEAITAYREENHLLESGMDGPDGCVRRIHMAQIKGQISNSEITAEAEMALSSPIIVRSEISLERVYAKRDETDAQKNLEMDSQLHMAEITKPHKTQETTILPKDSEHGGIINLKTKFERMENAKAELALHEDADKGIWSIDERPYPSAAVTNIAAASGQQEDDVKMNSSVDGENYDADKISKRHRTRNLKIRKQKKAPTRRDSNSVSKTVTPPDASLHQDLELKKTFESDTRNMDELSLGMSLINSGCEESSDSGAMTPEPKANAIDSTILDPNVKSCIMQQLAVNLGGNGSSMDSLMDLLLGRADNLESKMLAGTLVPNTEEECVAREKNAANLTNDGIGKEGITHLSGLNGEAMHVSDMETEVSTAAEESRTNYDSIDSDQETKDKSSENDLLPSAQSSLVESQLLLSSFQRESQPSASIKNSLEEPLLTSQEDDFVESSRATQPVQEDAHASSDRVDTLQKDTKSTERNSFTKTPSRVISRHAVCILEGTRYYRARVTVTEDSRIKIVKLKGGLDELGGSNDILEYLSKISSAQKPKRSN